MLGVDLALIYVYLPNFVYRPSEHLPYSHFRAKKVRDEREKRIKKLLNKPQNPFCSIFLIIFF
jgi:hypothetical protein